MLFLRTTRIILTFYKTFAIASLLLSAICAQLFWKYGIGIFFTIFWFKIITLALICYFIRTTKWKEFYYYQNLGVSKTLLWSTTVTADIVLFLVSLIVIYKVK
jgi:hypothetical protein